LKDEKEKQTNNELKLKNDQIDSLKNENKKITNIYEETIKSLKDDKDKQISNELKLKNEQLYSLKNEIEKIKNIYDETIKSLKNDKDKEYEQYKLNKEKEINDLLLEKRNYENNLNLNFKSKEYELNSIITKLNEEKDNIYDKYLEDKRQQLNCEAMVELYLEVSKQIKEFEVEKKRILDEIIKLADGKDSEIAGHKLTQVHREGAISYAKAVKDLLPDIDLSEYQSEPSSYWRLS
jgi:hypothetical protein